VATSKPSEPIVLLAKSMRVSLALRCLRRAGLARRRISSSRTDSVRNGIYQDRLVTQLD
jgi:hypothetical protein